MRGLTHRWIKPKPVGTDARSVGRQTPPLLQRVLASRGLTDAAEAERFCAPSLHEMHDPSTMPDLDRACARLLEALAAHERVVIYGDYDVDGVCASAILWRLCRRIDPEAIGSGRVTTYLPHRLDEGYGLHSDAMRAFADEGVGLVLSVDCGINAYEPASAARDAGVDLIITDHHHLPDDSAGLPDAYAIVHPARRSGADEAYAYPELCGAGIAFKLAWRLATMHAGSERVDGETRRVLLDALALAGLATIADVVPLTGENRVIARHGLERLKHSDIPGLRALVEASGLAGRDVGSQEAGYVLGPRLNACGRMGHAGAALELLTTAEDEHASSLARFLDAQNRDRRETERRIFDEAAERVMGGGLDHDDVRAIVLADRGWHPGVVGIVCSRLVGRFCRPTILLCDDGEEAKGSGRSIDGYSLYEGLASCAHVLERFGGHDMAAGLALRSDRVIEFEEQLRAHASRHVAPEMLTPALRIDCEARADELTHRAIDALQSMAPFGRSNPEPSLLVRGARVARSGETMGGSGAHLQLRIGDGRSRTIRVVGWGMGEHAPLLHEGMEVDLVVRPKISRWRGEERVELELRDVRLGAAV